jgi:hypothetical protein
MRTTHPDTETIYTGLSLRRDLHEAPGFSAWPLLLALLGSVVGTVMTGAFGSGQRGALAGAAADPVISTTFSTRRTAATKDTTCACAPPTTRTSSRSQPSRPESRPRRTDQPVQACGMNDQVGPDSRVSEVLQQRDAAPRSGRHLRPDAGQIEVRSLLDRAAGEPGARQLPPSKTVRLKPTKCCSCT